LHLEFILDILLMPCWCGLFKKAWKRNWDSLSSPKPDVLPGCATPRLPSFIGYTTFLSIERCLNVAIYEQF